MASRAQPAFLANERMNALLYPNDVRKVIAPTEESLKKLTRQHLIDYYDKYYKPAGALIGVAGDVSNKEIARQAGEDAGRRGRAPRPSRRSSPSTRRSSRRRSC